MDSSEQIRRAERPFRFEIPADLVPILRQLRARQKPWRGLIEDEDVVHLFYGMGPARFLTLDGRVLVDSVDWDDSAVYEVTEPKEAWAALMVGVITFKCEALRRLLPARPPTALTCPWCKGTGQRNVRKLIPSHPTKPTEKDFEVVCDFHGLGWVESGRDVTDIFSEILAQGRLVHSPDLGYSPPAKSVHAIFDGLETIHVTLRFPAGSYNCCSEEGCHLGLHMPKAWDFLRRAFRNRGLAPPVRFRLHTTVVVESGAFFFDPTASLRTTGPYEFVAWDAGEYEELRTEGEDGTN